MMRIPLFLLGLIDCWRLSLLHICIEVAVSILEAGPTSGSFAVVGRGLVSLVKS